MVDVECRDAVQYEHQLSRTLALSTTCTAIPRQPTFAPLPSAQVMVRAARITRNVKDEAEASPSVRRLSLHVLFLVGVVCFVLSSITLIYSLAGKQPRFSRAGRGVPQHKTPALGPPPPLPPPRISLRTVWWHAPFFSSSGMGWEAIQLVLGLQRHTEYGGRVWASSHGDLDRVEVFEGLPDTTKEQLVRMVQAADAATLRDARFAIIVCHSEPGAWALPQPLYQTSLCPPVPIRDTAYTVARAMFETDRLTSLHVQRWVSPRRSWLSCMLPGSASSLEAARDARRCTPITGSTRCRRSGCPPTSIATCLPPQG